MSFRRRECFFDAMQPFDAGEVYVNRQEAGHRRGDAT
jgi:hypothetical protein